MKIAISGENTNISITEKVLTIYWKKPFDLIITFNLIQEFNQTKGQGSVKYDKIVDPKHDIHAACHMDNPMNGQEGFSTKNTHSHIMFKSIIDDDQLAVILNILSKHKVINDVEMALCKTMCREEKIKNTLSK